MKKIFLLLVAFPLTLNAQHEISNLTSASHTSLAMQSVSFDDGSYVEIFSYLDEIGQMDFEFRRKDVNNVLIEATTYSTDAYYPTIVGVIKSADNSFIIAMDYANQFDFIKVNQNNDISWSKRISVTEFYGKYFNHKVVSSPNGFYLMISDVIGLGVVKFDLNGNKIWSTKINTNEFKSPGFELVERPDGDVQGTLKDDTRQCLVTINGTNGSLISSESLNNFEYRWPKIIRYDNDGNMIVAGDVSSSMPYFQKYNVSGTLVLAKVITGVYYGSIQDFKFDEQGNVYILLKNGQDLSIVKLNTQLNYVWNKSIGGLTDNLMAGQFPIMVFAKFLNNRTDNLDFTTFSNGKPVKIAFDGDVSGLCNSFSFAPYQVVDDVDALSAGPGIMNSAAALPLTVEFVNGAFFTPGGISIIDTKDFCQYILSAAQPSAEIDITVFPNPSNGKVTVKADSGIESVEVIDLHGRVIESVSASGQPTLNIDLGYLNAGIYYVNTLLDSGKSTMKKILIE